ncbi:MAG: preprotein translocase subunit SecY [Candidatus Paceibacterota bacterium]|jgi:preprotein translocase subunit SecY
MQNFIEKVTIAFRDPILRKRIGFAVIALVIFRALASIPIPGIDPVALAKLLSSSQLLGFLNIFSGGGLSNLSIVMLGVGPFITASIIIQLLTMMFPSWKALMHEEGDAGRMKLSQYSRLIGAPLAVVQGIGFIILLQSQNVLPQMDIFSFIVNVIVVSAGSMLLMWIGELISEFGIGNGVSLIIFAGIVSSLPTAIVQNYQKIITAGASDLPFYLAVLVIAIASVAGVVYVTEAERSVPVTYAKQVRGNKVYGGSSTYLPLRLNQSGVIPIIFALSILMFPQIIASALAKWAAYPTIASLASYVVTLFNNQWFYGAVYFVLVVLFTYFYTAVTFDPKMISENLQRSGAFIPGVRPGEDTQEHIGNIVTRITLVGALFLGAVAILPLIIQAFSPGNDRSVAVGGTALLIVVSVVLDLLKKVDAQVAMREY